MPKNKFGGSKHKKAKNNISSTALRLKEVNQEYAKVNFILGNCRFKIQCSDGVERLGILRGNMKKKKYVNKDDIVLIERWDELQNDKCSIIDVYKSDEVKRLKKQNEIPSLFFIEENTDVDEYNPFDVSYSGDILSDESEEELETKEELEAKEEEIDLDEI